MLFKKLLTFAAIIAMLSGCSENPFADAPDECDFTAPQITSNSPVTAGTDIIFDAPYVNNGIYYWTGPNGYVSHEQNPIINLATPEMAGTYSLSIGNEIDGCIMPTATTTVEVLAATAPCSPANNTATNSVYPAMSFYYVNASNVPYTYEIDANGSNGDMTITFKDEATPTAGMYSICEDCPTSFLEANQICVSMVAGNTYYVAQSGEVYVSFVNGKISATFCNVPFAGGDSGITFTASAKVTDQ